MEDHLVLDLEDRFYKCGFGDENFYQVTWRSRGFEGAYFISNDSLTICIHGALNWDNEPQEIANYLIKESIKLSGLGAWPPEHFSISV